PLKGRAAFVAGHAIDVTAMENVQSELSSHITAQRDFLKSLATAIAIFGPDRRLKFYNRAFVVLWHFKASALDTEPQLGELLELLWEDRQLPELVDFPARKQAQDRLFVSVI
ncbi:MAG: sensor histidine kinase, partial [Pseudomonadota bacterium]|nr:sensor histidine kinase [Pseudomonadota bacterium]